MRSEVKNRVSKLESAQGADLIKPKILHLYWVTCGEDGRRYKSLGMIMDINDPDRKIEYVDGPWELDEET